MIQPEWFLKYVSKFQVVEDSVKLLAAWPEHKFDSNFCSGI